MTISVVFDPPLRSDSPAVFNSKAFTLVGDLNNWSNEANALASDVTSKQTTASNAATTATNQADLANSSRIAAQDAAAAAAASYDSFDDRYLGAKASDPTLDNDGNALIEGALYWNSTAKETRTWNGTAWVTTSVANAVSRGGDTMTGPMSVPAGASGAQVPRAQEIGTLADAQLTTHYKRSNILGTVSQSGGVPTGAVIEKGSNANGSYVRFADGTQVCWHSVTTSGTTSIGWTFAAAFSGTPVIGYCGDSSVVPVITTYSNLIASSVEFHGWAVSGGRQAASNLVIAIGRWF